jgi:SAM-dependent methyltransferase
VRSLKARVPWWARIPVKIVLSRLPVPFAAWRRLALFQHGAMNSGAYVWFVFGRHLPEFLRPNGLAGKTLLELGPGDGIATGLLASALGAEHTWLVDVGGFASRSVATYQGMLAGWRERGLPTEHLEGCTSFEELCAAGRTTYLTGGLASLRAVATASVDVQISNAVLEHVRLSQFDPTLAELRRVLKPGGFARHAVDLKDHLGGRLEHLRFAERRWESPFFARSGFYTNRIRFEAMLARFRCAGFDASVSTILRWPDLPTPRARLHPPFRALADEELCVSAFDVELRARAAAPAARAAA